MRWIRSRTKTRKAEIVDLFRRLSIKNIQLPGAGGSESQPLTLLPDWLEHLERLNYIEDGSVTAAKLATNAVTNIKIEEVDISKVTVTGHFTPVYDNVSNLGSSALRWADLYLAGSITLPSSSDDGIRFGSTSNGAFIWSSAADGGVLTLQALGNGETSSLHVQVTSGMLPATGQTLSEFVVTRTSDQAFGGNYNRISLSAIAGSPAATAGNYFLHQEAGGTNTIKPMIFSLAYEDPPSTFTDYEYMRFENTVDTSGAVLIGAGDFAANQTPHNALVLIPPNLTAAGTRDAHAIMWRGNYFDTSINNVDWREFTDVTTTAGASVQRLQSRIGGGSFTDRVIFTDTGQIGIGAVTPNYTGQFHAASGHSIVQLTNATTGSGAADGSYIGIISGLSAFRIMNQENDNLELYANGALQVTVGPSTIGFFGGSAVVKQTSGANLTNNVTAGGTDDTIANYTDLVTYANDAAAIRNDVYQLARKLKQINDGLRTYGLFT